MMIVKRKSNVQFNLVLKKLMESKKVGVKELSKTSGIPQSTLSSYLHGVKASYDPTHLQTLSAVFSVSLEFLLFGREKNPVSALNSLLTEQVFSGYLKVNIERVIPGKVIKDE